MQFFVGSLRENVISGRKLAKKLPVDNSSAKLNKSRYLPYTEGSESWLRQMLWYEGEMLVGEMLVRLQGSGIRAIRTLLVLLAFGFMSACDDGGADGTPDDLLADSPVYEFSIVADDIVLGDPTAPVTVIEYANFSCSHCATFHKETFPLLKEHYIDTGKIQFVFREFTGDGPGVFGAMLARCAGPDRYMAFADLLFETQDDWAYTVDFAAELARIAASRGVSGQAFETCIQDEAQFEALMERGKMASETYELTGTPGFLVDGRVVPGAVTFETFDKILKVALTNAGAGE